MTSLGLSLRNASANRGRYSLGFLAVAIATAFIMAGSVLISALENQLRADGADNSGLSAGLFVLLGTFGIVVAVAAGFVIANAFQTIIAARTKELALLRTVGMRRRQVFRTVLAEGLIIGLAGSLTGLLVGFLTGNAVVLFALPEAGLSFPGPASTVTALLVGVGVTLTSVGLPARAATRVPPMAALSASQTMVGQSVGRVRAVGGVVVLAAGVVLGLTPATAGIAVLVFTAGALISFAGMALLAPLAVPGFARVGRLFGDLGPVLALAVGNLDRARRRVANTVVAVVLGMTLVTGVLVVLGSAEAAARAEGYAQDSTGSYALALGLTGVTLLVSLVGVLNTVVLGVRERGRELVLLRAVGMTAQEVRRTVTVEGLMLGIAGVLLGVAFGYLGASILLGRLDEAMTVAAPWTLIGGVAALSLAVVAMGSHRATRAVASASQTSVVAL